MILLAHQCIQPIEDPYPLLPLVIAVFVMTTESHLTVLIEYLTKTQLSDYNCITKPIRSVNYCIL